MDIEATKTKRAPVGTIQRRRRWSCRFGERHSEHRVARKLPHVVKKATRDAYTASLEAGLDVHVIQGGTVYRVTPDGTRTPLREVEPPVRVRKGEKRKFR